MASSCLHPSMRMRDRCKGPASCCRNLRFRQRGSRSFEHHTPCRRERQGSARGTGSIRAVTEGLRIWTTRPFFKENPSIAIALIGKHKAHESKYLRKSVGNALRDISKEHAELIRDEVQRWELSNPRILFTYKLAAKLLN